MLPLELHNLISWWYYNKSTVNWIFLLDQTTKDIFCLKTLPHSACLYLSLSLCGLSLSLTLSHSLSLSLGNVTLSTTDSPLWMIVTMHVSAKGLYLLLYSISLRTFIITGLSPLIGILNKMCTQNAPFTSTDNNQHLPQATIQTLQYTTPMAIPIKPLPPYKSNTTPLWVPYILTW